MEAPGSSRHNPDPGVHQRLEGARSVRLRPIPTDLIIARRPPRRHDQIAASGSNPLPPGTGTTKPSIIRAPAIYVVANSP